MILIDGKKIAAEIREELKKEVSDLKSKIEYTNLLDVLSTLKAINQLIITFAITM